MPVQQSETPKQEVFKKTSLYKPVLEYEQAVINAVDAAADGVVSVVISKNLPKLERCIIDPFGDLPPEFRGFFGGFGFQIEGVCPSGTEEREVSSGSGFVIDDTGLIATNKHVVLDKEASYTVITNDGRQLKARVEALDPLLDLGFLKVENPVGLKPLKLGNSDSLKLGQTVIAIGNALGEFRNTVSVGVVSGLARRVAATGPGISETIEGAIQTDAAINRGHSGGPLINLRGEVIGINVAMALGSENIGFAIPVNQVKRSIGSVKSTGKILEEQ